MNGFALSPFKIRGLQVREAKAGEKRDEKIFWRKSRVTH
jgi:hypothetical protein